MVAHRNEWMRGRLAAELDARGVGVVATVGDGAHALGTVVVEQPDLLLVEDLLPTLSGAEVLGRARRLAPSMLAAAQTADQPRVPTLVRAGARVVFTRQVPPATVVEELLRCLHEPTDSSPTLP